MRYPVPAFCVVVALWLVSSTGFSNSSSGGGPSTSGPADSAPAFVQAPGLIGAPNPTTPLAAIITARTDVPTVLRLTVDDGEDVRASVPDPTLATDHAVTLLGLRPDRIHAIDVVAVDAAGNETPGPARLTLTTPPLPASFPPISVTTRSAEGLLVEPGVTLFNASFAALGDQPLTYLVMIDGAGDVVWYHDAQLRVGDVRRLGNGNLLFQFGSRGQREIDMLGNTVAEWIATGYDPSLPAGSVPVDIDSFHHEVYELPAGDTADFLTLSSELRAYPDYPTSEVDPSQTEPEAMVIGDVVVTFRRDGTVVNEWPLLDLLDPYRMCYDSLKGSWKLVYTGETRDWGHANAVILDPSDGNLVVSLRNQDAVIKIDRTTGELLWILGPHDRWQAPWADKLLEPTVPALSERGTSFAWSFHQHAPMFTPTGGLLLFDNGNERAIPPAEALPADERYSRLVEYVIDEEQMTVTQVWEHGGPAAPWYSQALGDADHMPQTGNVLGVDGFRASGESQRFARLVEVTGSAPAEPVWEVIIQDARSDPPVSWSIYRAERLASVAP